MLACPPIQAQRLTLDNAIRIAQENSYSAQVAQFSYMASYWNYRSFKAQLMPAVNLRGKIANFDHSLIETRNYEDGRLKTMKAYFFSHFRHIPRNDGNCVEVGDEYALFCWYDGEWQEIAHQVATKNELRLENMPANGLYLLRDLTEGVEERIFLV